jgi:hypothetical protein
MVEMINEVLNVYPVANRPPGVIDYIIIEKMGEKLPAEEFHYEAFCLTHRMEIIKRIRDLERNSPELRRVHDLLLPENVRYAVEKVVGYKRKYEGVKLADVSVESIVHLKNSRGEDLSVTDDDLREEALFPDGWMVDGKIGRVKQSGGSVSEVQPKQYKYTNIDLINDALICAADNLLNLGFKKDDNYLLLIPSGSHYFGYAQERASDLIGVNTFYRHFIRGASEQTGGTKALLGLIRTIKPDVLMTSPIGPKSATGSAEALLKQDSELPRRVLPTFLGEKMLTLGGAPIPLEPTNIIKEYYEDVGIREVWNGYGSTITSGHFDCEPIPKNPSGRTKDVKFLSKSHAQINWIVQPYEISKEAGRVPEPWKEIVITVLGREAGPVINYRIGDYAVLGHCDKLATVELSDICRKSWFKPQTDGSYTVEIPAGADFCVSHV